MSENNSSQKLRVCHFTYSFFPLIGGMEEVIHNLSISMISQGCEPYVFAPYVRGMDNRLDVPYEVFRYSRPSSKRLGLRQLLVPLLWYYIKYRFNILHCHGVYPPGYVGASFHKITGVPFVITPYGGDIEEIEKGLIMNSRIIARMKKALSTAQAVTVISSDIKAHILNIGTPANKVYIIPFGVFLNEFRTSKEYHQQNNNNNRYILYLGRLIKRKGVDVLIEAFSKISNDYPGLRLKIAGYGREKSNLITLANDLGINKKIDFVGLVRGREKLQLLHNALFLICPSRTETFPVVNLEALASGIPVITSRVGGIPDIIQDGENGFLVEPENPEHLAVKMDSLLKDAVLRKRMAENAISTVLQYDWNVIVQKYIDIYEEL